MAMEPLFVIPFPNSIFKITVILLFASSCLHPASPRPSAENPHHTVPHENTDVLPQQSEALDNDNDQLVTEIEISEEQEFEDDLKNEEDYPQHDAPVNDNVDNNGPRKVDNRQAKPHHVKNGRRIISEQLTAVMKATSEANDSITEVLEDPEEFNNTFNADHGDNTSMTDENFIRLSKNNRESQEFDHADRNRELRLNAIKELLQSYRSGVVGADPKPTKLPIEVFETIMGKLNVSQPPPLDAYPMKRRSFHPSCSLPNNTDVEMWTDSNSMNLLFNLTYPAPQNTTVTIIAATLRLYKFSQGNKTAGEPSCGPNVSPVRMTEIDVDELSEPQRDSPVIPEINVPLLPPTPGPVTLQDDDKQIRVSIYWYTRSLKKNKVKRKLLDSRMLPVYGNDELVEFNVRHAARQWRQLGKNFGLVVEVENEDGELLKASDYFKTMNCSNEQQQNHSLEFSCKQSAQSWNQTTVQEEQVLILPPSSVDPPDSLTALPTETALEEEKEILDLRSPQESSTTPLMFIRFCSP